MSVGASSKAYACPFCSQARSVGSRLHGHTGLGTHEPHQAGHTVCKRQRLVQAALGESAFADHVTDCHPAENKPVRRQCPAARSDLLILARPPPPPPPAPFLPLAPALLLRGFCSRPYNDRASVVSTPLTLAGCGRRGSSARVSHCRAAQVICPICSHKGEPSYVSADFASHLAQVRGGPSSTVQVPSHLAR